MMRITAAVPDTNYLYSTGQPSGPLPATQRQPQQKRCITKAAFPIGSLYTPASHRIQFSSSLSSYSMYR